MRAPFFLHCVFALAFGSVVTSGSHAQGQDSTAVQRDRLVIAELLPGVWSNNNQTYFERRRGVPENERHAGLLVTVATGDDGALNVGLNWNRSDAATSTWTIELNDGADAVEMTLTPRASRARSCTVLWRREAAQFRGLAVGGAGCAGLPAAWVLSERELWLAPLTAPETPTPGDYRLHRTRSFECYADLPGVGGGRDEPYERYGPFSTHDGGGLVRFTTKDDDARDLAFSLWRVDWPINNYEGVFTRDVLTLSIIEYLDNSESPVERGYSFTEPDVERLGVNLKWILVNCYRQSNADTTPFM